MNETLEKPAAEPAQDPAAHVKDAVDPVVYVENIVRRSGTSFYWAMRVLPQRKRSAMFGIYAFSREVDDIADGFEPIEVKKAQLGLWRGEVERLYRDRPRNPVMQALAGAIEEFGLSKEDFHAIIAGMEMDAEDRVRIADMDDLNLYCDRVACAVGRLSNCVFGVDGDSGRELAFALGQALQLTNILRDIPEDAVRDRLYIPQDLLTAHEVAGEDLNKMLESLGFARACEILAGIAANRFEQAAAIMDGLDRKKVRPPRMMMEIYRRVLDKLMRRGWRNLYFPVGLSKPLKLWIAFRFGIL